MDFKQYILTESKFETSKERSRRIAYEKKLRKDFDKEISDYVKTLDSYKKAKNIIKSIHSGPNRMILINVNYELADDIDSAINPNEDLNAVDVLKKLISDLKLKYKNTFIDIEGSQDFIKMWNDLSKKSKTSKSYTVITMEHKDDDDEDDPTFKIYKDYDKNDVQEFVNSLDDDIDNGRFVRVIAIPSTVKFDLNKVKNNFVSRQKSFVNPGLVDYKKVI